MIICAAGDIHGAIDRLYDDVLAFEHKLGVTFDHVLHVGDFGVWPDPSRIDKATKKHDGAGDFAAWLASRRAVPRHTVFIKGNHEDFDWLDAQPNAEVLPGLVYLRNAQTIDLGEGRDAVRVGGLGGCFGPSNYDRKSTQLRGNDKRHYTRDEIDTLGRRKDIDILLLHDAPAGVRFDGVAGRQSWVSEAVGLDSVLSTLRPRVCFFGHHHARVDADIAGVRCIGLNLVGHVGNLVAIELDASDRSWRVLGEWPTERRQHDE